MTVKDVDDGHQYLRISWGDHPVLLVVVLVVLVVALGQASIHCLVSSFSCWRKSRGTVRMISLRIPNLNEDGWMDGWMDGGGNKLAKLSNVTCYSSGSMRDERHHYYYKVDGNLMVKGTREGPLVICDQR